MTALTVTYGSIHDAFTQVARDFALTPFEVRVLVALFERGGAGSSVEVNAEMAQPGHGSMLRRASLTLRHRGLIQVDAVDGGDVRQGIHARFTLTPGGEEIAAVAVRRAHG